MYFRLCFAFAIICSAAFLQPLKANADVKTVTPADDIQKAVNGLAAGDTLYFSEGIYTRKTALYFKKLKGTEDAPIVVGPAPGAHAVIKLDSTYTKFVLADWDHNNIHVQKCHYLEIFGFEITAGRTGIEAEFVNSHCTFRDLHIHHVGNVGIRIASGSSHHMKCLGNHIHHTYMHGEGYYIGDNDGRSKINNTIFEGNYIHDTSILNDQGDGVELKRMTWGNHVRYNVIHSVHYPGVIVWGTGRKDPKYNNKVYGNLIFNARAGEAGMQVSSEVDIFNNIIINDGNGKMYSALHTIENLHSGEPMNHVRIYNNTFFGVEKGVGLMSWEGKEGMVFANNAIYCPKETDEAIITDAAKLDNAIIEGNRYFGTVTGDGLKKYIGKGLQKSEAAGSVFVNPDGEMSSIDLTLLPGSSLVDAAQGEWIAESDFMQQARLDDASADVGALELNGRGQFKAVFGNTFGLKITTFGGKAFDLSEKPANLAYSVPAGNKGAVSVAIYDTRGRLIKILADGVVDSGIHKLTWNGLDELGGIVSKGVYFVRLDTASGEHLRRIMILN